MLKKRLSLLLMLLIASQSVWSTMDIPQQHQSNNEHFITEHNHDHQQNEDRTDLGRDGTAAHNDHNHCHSHSSQFHFITDAIIVSLSNNISMLNTTYKSAASSAPLSNLFRPPRI